MAKGSKKVEFLGMKRRKKCQTANKRKKRYLWMKLSLRPTYLPFHLFSNLCFLLAFFCLSCIASECFVSKKVSFPCTPPPGLGFRHLDGTRFGWLDHWHTVVKSAGVGNEWVGSLIFTFASFR
ncbi:hypothetical protein K402DRAFT_172655 [Aulographum hederae CBS 113979]|uniref:Uncharacterized protein n=1 Tax=Aulographum hederae CBS 113979 TaxID=1176131 RepID=A0A6G1HDE5_9PEZI|nr:hypothetical protein K402DRAFT_172655 [Aulographum hederae CBS 113979]